MPHEQIRAENSASGAPGDDPAVTVSPAPDGVILEPPSVDDGRLLWRLARDAGLDLNSPYAYALWCRDFAATSVAARDPGGELRGFVTGYVRPDAPDTYFLWQVGVDPAFRGRRLARRMLDHIGDRIEARGVTHLEATVTPDNTASRRLFASFARDRGAEARWSPLFERDHFPHDGPDGHEPEELVRIGPLGRARSGPSERSS
ncbi:diaminobutyrate acetyltransferase [Nocardiopsis mangrovi]|uniref:L-2,4-diaminobutyric acid acetyltransferase n=1 Tax=Nocardiopsis mangrovi TaxID=1179818 RepID=A0ABV9DWB8_9ACTN